VHLQANAAFSPEIRNQMKMELDSILEPAAIRIFWLDAQESRDFRSMRVELKGSCGVPNHADGHAVLGAIPASALASTSVYKDSILPSSWVNCDTLNRLLLSSIALQPKWIRDYAYGRAMARVLAHEIYHILAQTQVHTSTGVAKESVSAADLVSSRFVFNSEAIIGLRSHNRVLLGAAKN